MGAPRSFNGERTLFHKCCWENWKSTWKKMKLDPYLTPYEKMNSKWIEDINVRAKAIKYLEENIEKKLHNTGFGYDFLDMTPKEEINWNTSKLKTFVLHRTQINRVKW